MRLYYPHVGKAGDYLLSKPCRWGKKIILGTTLKNCSIPCIATNWSGPADFMGEAWSYPLQIEGTGKISGSTENFAQVILSPRNKI